jgi:hypothetical protein
MTREWFAPNLSQYPHFGFVKHHVNPLLVQCMVPDSPLSASGDSPATLKCVVPHLRVNLQKNRGYSIN